MKLGRSRPRRAALLFATFAAVFAWSLPACSTTKKATPTNTPMPTATPTLAVAASPTPTSLPTSSPTPLPGSGPLAFVTDETSNQVSVISLLTNTVVATVVVGSGPTHVAIRP